MDVKNFTPCRFCGHLKGASPDPIDTPWLQDAEYSAMISKGAMVPGWTLICPSLHGLSLAEHYRRPEFWDFANKAEAFVRARYGDVRVFEHGAGFVGSPTGCGTDHAHMHLVPLAFGLATETIRFDAALTWQACRATDISHRVVGREYLFVSDKFEGTETTGLLSVLDTPTSQFFRRVVASRLGLREFYDYRRHPMLEIAHDSVEELRADVLAGVPVAAR